MVDDPRLTWWRASDAPPPTAWLDIYSAFTAEESADEWGLAAAIFIARTRRRTGAGPTFSEMFIDLLPDTRGLPSPLPKSIGFMQRRRLIADFRLFSAIEWKRRGWITWETKLTRSLRVGRAFREQSRQHQAAHRGSVSQDGTSAAARARD